ncbi:hypothetical protein ABEB36_001501 [Hypothenemus hampei]|uniref:Uncharacterized protein n=1 Tax=Hypothenemus hampei TaxID=57062 RepID=A0ABD1FGL2_HYPHA
MSDRQDQDPNEQDVNNPEEQQPPQFPYHMIPPPPFAMNVYNANLNEIQSHEQYMQYYLLQSQAYWYQQQQLLYQQYQANPQQADQQQQAVSISSHSNREPADPTSGSRETQMSQSNRYQAQETQQQPVYPSTSGTSRWDRTFRDTHGEYSGYQTQRSQQQPQQQPQQPQQQPQQPVYPSTSGVARVNPSQSPRGSREAPCNGQSVQEDQQSAHSTPSNSTPSSTTTTTTTTSGSSDREQLRIQQPYRRYRRNEDPFLGPPEFDPDKPSEEDIRDPLTGLRIRFRCPELHDRIDPELGRIANTPRRQFVLEHLLVREGPYACPCSYRHLSYMSRDPSLDYLEPLAWLAPSTLHTPFYMDPSCLPDENLWVERSTEEPSFGPTSTEPTAPFSRRLQDFEPVWFLESSYMICAPLEGVNDRLSDARIASDLIRDMRVWITKYVTGARGADSLLWVIQILMYYLMGIPSFDKMTRRCINIINFIEYFMHTVTTSLTFLHDVKDEERGDFFFMMEQLIGHYIRLVVDNLNYHDHVSKEENSENLSMDPYLVALKVHKILKRVLFGRFDSILIGITLSQFRRLNSNTSRKFMKHLLTFIFDDAALRRTGDDLTDVEEFAIHSLFRLLESQLFEEDIEELKEFISIHFISLDILKLKLSNNRIAQLERADFLFLIDAFQNIVMNTFGSESQRIDWLNNPGLIIEPPMNRPDEVGPEQPLVPRDLKAVVERTCLINPRSPYRILISRHLMKHCDNFSPSLRLLRIMGIERVRRAGYIGSYDRDHEHCDYRVGYTHPHWIFRRWAYSLLGRQHNVNAYRLRRYLEEEQRREREYARNQPPLEIVDLTLDEAVEIPNVESFQSDQYETTLHEMIVSMFNLMERGYGPNPLGSVSEILNQQPGAIAGPSRLMESGHELPAEDLQSQPEEMAVDLEPQDPIEGQASGSSQIQHENVMEHTLSSEDKTVQKQEEMASASNEFIRTASLYSSDQSPVDEATSETGRETSSEGANISKANLYESSSSEFVEPDQIMPPPQRKPLLRSRGASLEAHSSQSDGTQPISSDDSVSRRPHDQRSSLDSTPPPSLAEEAQGEAAARSLTRDSGHETDEVTALYSGFSSDDLTSKLFDCKLKMSKSETTSSTARVEDISPDQIRLPFVSNPNIPKELAKPKEGSVSSEKMMFHSADDVSSAAEAVESPLNVSVGEEAGVEENTSQVKGHLPSEPRMGVTALKEKFESYGEAKDEYKKEKHSLRSSHQTESFEPSTSRDAEPASSRSRESLGVSIPIDKIKGPQLESKQRRLSKDSDSSKEEPSKFKPTTSAEKSFETKDASSKSSDERQSWRKPESKTPKSSSTTTFKDRKPIRSDPRQSTSKPSASEQFKRDVKGVSKSGQSSTSPSLRKLSTDSGSDMDPKNPSKKPWSSYGTVPKSQQTAEGKRSSTSITTLSKESSPPPRRSSVTSASRQPSGGSTPKIPPRGSSSAQRTTETSRPAFASGVGQSTSNPKESIGSTTKSDKESSSSSSRRSSLTSTSRQPSESSSSKFPPKGSLLTQRTTEPLNPAFTSRVGQSTSISKESKLHSPSPERKQSIGTRRISGEIKSSPSSTSKPSPSPPARSPSRRDSPLHKRVKTLSEENSTKPPEPTPRICRSSGPNVPSPKKQVRRQSDSSDTSVEPPPPSTVLKRVRDPKEEVSDLPSTSTDISIDKSEYEAKDSPFYKKTKTTEEVPMTYEDTILTVEISQELEEEPPVLRMELGAPSEHVESEMPIITSDTERLGSVGERASVVSTASDLPVLEAVVQDAFPHMVAETVYALEPAMQTSESLTSISTISRSDNDRPVESFQDESADKMQSSESKLGESLTSAGIVPTVTDTENKGESANSNVEAEASTSASQVTSHDKEESIESSSDNIDKTQIGNASKTLEGDLEKNCMKKPLQSAEKSFSSISLYSGMRTRSRTSEPLQTSQKCEKEFTVVHYEDLDKKNVSKSNRNQNENTHSSVLPDTVLPPLAHSTLVPISKSFSIDGLSKKSFLNLQSPRRGASELKLLEPTSCTAFYNNFGKEITEEEVQTDQTNNLTITNQVSQTDVTDNSITSQCKSNKVKRMSDSDVGTMSDGDGVIQEEPQAIDLKVNRRPLSPKNVFSESTKPRFNVTKSPFQSTSDFINPNLEELSKGLGTPRVYTQAKFEKQTRNSYEQELARLEMEQAHTTRRKLSQNVQYLTQHSTVPSQFVTQGHTTSIPKRKFFHITTDSNELIDNVFEGPIGKPSYNQPNLIFDGMEPVKSILKKEQKVPRESKMKRIKFGDIRDDFQSVHVPTDPYSKKLFIKVKPRDVVPVDIIQDYMDEDCRLEEEQERLWRLKWEHDQAEERVQALVRSMEGKERMEVQPSGFVHNVFNTSKNSPGLSYAQLNRVRNEGTRHYNDDLTRYSILQDENVVMHNHQITESIANYNCINHFNVKSSLVNRSEIAAPSQFYYPNLTMPKINYNVVNHNMNPNIEPTTPSFLSSEVQTHLPHRLAQRTFYKNEKVKEEVDEEFTRRKVQNVDEDVEEEADEKKTHYFNFSQQQQHFVGDSFRFPETPTPSPVPLNMNLPLGTRILQKVNPVTYKEPSQTAAIDSGSLCFSADRSSYEIAPTDLTRQLYDRRHELMIQSQNVISQMYPEEFTRSLSDLEHQANLRKLSTWNTPKIDSGDRQQEHHLYMPLPPKKRRINDTGIKIDELIMTNNKTIDLKPTGNGKLMKDDISYPAARQLSIADVQNLNMKTVAARKQYPDIPGMNLFNNIYDQMDNGKSTSNVNNNKNVMNVYINGEIKDYTNNDKSVCVMIRMDRKEEVASPSANQYHPHHQPQAQFSAPTLPVPTTHVIPSQVVEESVTPPRSRRGRKGNISEKPPPPMKRGRGRPKKTI